MQVGATVARRFTLVRPVDYDVPGVDTFVATDNRLQTEVIVHIASSLAPSVVRQSATRASLLRDPRLARVLATGREGTGDDASTYVVVAQPQGANLADVLARHQLSPELAATIVCSLAEALAGAAASGHHHGLVRPAAITVTREGVAVLAGLGLDGELATQAGIGRGRTERADAVALGRLYLAAVTGMDADEVTQSDIPDELPTAAKTMCDQVVRGTGPRTLASVVRATSVGPRVAMRGFPQRVKALPLRPDVAAAELAAREEAERRATAEAERIAAQEAIRVAAERAGMEASALEALLDDAEPQPAPDASDIVIDPSSLDLAAREAADREAIEHASAALIAEIEAELAEAGAPPLTEAEAAKLHDLYTFDHMVAAQNWAPDPSVWEALLERLHERHPASQALTRRLEAARVRAQRPAPFSPGPLILALGVAGVVIAAIISFSAVSQPIDPDFDRHNNPDNTYPPFTFSPPPLPSPSTE